MTATVGVTVVPPLPVELVPAGVRVLPLQGAEPLAVYAVTRLEDERREVALAVACLAELFAGVRPADEARRQRSASAARCPPAPTR